jgi:hypothetical protein
MAPDERSIAVKEIVETEEKETAEQAGIRCRDYIIGEALAGKLDALKFLITKKDPVVEQIKEELMKLFDRAGFGGDLKLKAAKVGYEALFLSVSSGEYLKKSFDFRKIEAVDGEAPK